MLKHDSGILFEQTTERRTDSPTWNTPTLSLPYVEAAALTNNVFSKLQGPRQDPSVGSAIGQSLGQKKDQREYAAYLEAKRQEWSHSLTKPANLESPDPESEDSAQDRFKL